MPVRHAEPACCCLLCPPAIRLLDGAGWEGHLEHPLLAAAVKAQQLVAPAHTRALAAGGAGGGHAEVGHRSSRQPRGATQQGAVQHRLRHGSMHARQINSDSKRRSAAQAATWEHACASN